LSKSTLPEMRWPGVTSTIRSEVPTVVPGTSVERTFTPGRSDSSNSRFSSGSSTTGSPLFRPARSLRTTLSDRLLVFRTEISRYWPSLTEMVTRLSVTSCAGSQARATK